MLVVEEEEEEEEEMTMVEMEVRGVVVVSGSDEGGEGGRSDWCWWLRRSRKRLRR